MRMLGSGSDADDAVQEAWLRFNRSDVGDVRNLRGWLTTVVARICLDALRSRAAHREDPLDDVEAELEDVHGVDPEQQAVLADSVGAALQVVLQTLSPAERLALVLHDMFDVPFAEIGPMIGRSPNATAQLAARGRRRVRSRAAEHGTHVAAQRQVVDAFLAAARAGDVDALVAVLRTDVELRADAVAAGGAPVTVRGASEVAANARMFAHSARHTEAALVDGSVGLVVVPDGRLTLVLQFVVEDHAIRAIDIHADPDRLDQFEFAILG
jgi:RNA polymerase sigma-70 factor (ECF subfamily)